MKSITSKEIKKYILDYNELNELSEYIEIDIKDTIEGIFNALSILLKKYDQNKKRVDLLIAILNDLVEKKSANELKVMIGPIIDLQNKMSSWSVKDRIKVKRPSIEIQNIFNEIQRNLLAEKQNEKIKCLEFIIFYDKNISMLENYLKEQDNLLNKINQEGEDILTIILKKYINTINEEEINYLYHVILVFLNSPYRDEILNNKEKYLKKLKIPKLQSMSHIVRLFQLFDSEFNITYQELEKKYEIHFQFPTSIINEINTFQMKNMKRNDYTNQQSITIDGESACCLDDAIYLEKNKDGTYSLYIHITDIPSFVPFSSMTREEASYRVETLYLRNSNLPLYPEFISNEVCSLLPNNYRNTITYIFQLDSKLKLIPGSFQITLGKIKVEHRLTYEEVDARIKKPTESNLDRMLIQLSEFANQRRMINQGKEVYREYENFINLMPNHESVKLDYSLSANIVHESMILVNYEVANYFKKLGYPYIYRKLNVPSAEFIAETVRRIKNLGPNIGNDKAFISNLRDSYIESFYCNEPAYHDGLKLDCYSHSTSPGRRYMDSLGQYLIHDLIIKKNITNQSIDTWEYRIDRAIHFANERRKQNESFTREYNYLLYKKLIKEKK